MQIDDGHHHHRHQTLLYFHRLPPYIYLWHLWLRLPTHCLPRYPKLGTVRQPLPHYRFKVVVDWPQKQEKTSLWTSLLLLLLVAPREEKQ